MIQVNTGSRLESMYSPSRSIPRVARDLPQRSRDFRHPLTLTESKVWQAARVPPWSHQRAMSNE